MSFPPSNPRKIKPIGADGHRKRMIAKFITAYDKDLYKRDLLEILLFYSIPVRDTRDIAVNLMQENGGNIYKVLDSPADKLCKVNGIGPKSAALLKTAGIIVKRTASGNTKDDTSNGKNYLNFDDIMKLLKEDEPDQRLYIAYNISKYRYGGVLSAPVKDRDAVSRCSSEILRQAIIEHAVGVTAFRLTNRPSDSLPEDLLNIYNLDSIMTTNHIPLFAYYLTDGQKLRDFRNIYS